MELLDIRKEIDAVDGELVELFCKRMELSAAVAEYKKQNNMPILDAERERELLLKVYGLSDEKFGEYTKELYETLLRLSRSYQERILQGEGKL